MQNVDVIKSHYLKGKQLFGVSVKVMMLAFSKYVLRFLHRKQKKRKEYLQSRLSHRMLRAYLTSMKFIRDLDHFRGGHLTFEGGVDNCEKTVSGKHTSASRKKYISRIIIRMKKLLDSDCLRAV